MILRDPGNSNPELRKKKKCPPTCFPAPGSLVAPESTLTVTECLPGSELSLQTPWCWLRLLERTKTKINNTKDNKKAKQTNKNNSALYGSKHLRAVETCLKDIRKQMWLIFKCFRGSGETSLYVYLSGKSQSMKSVPAFSWTSHHYYESSDPINAILYPHPRSLQAKLTWVT